MNLMAIVQTIGPIFGEGGAMQRGEEITFIKHLLPTI